MLNAESENESFVHLALAPIYYKKFDIIIPAYNEEKRIVPVLTDLTLFIENYKLPWRIIVSIDGNDGTEKIVKEFSKEFNFIKYSRSSERGGKGLAIKRVSSIIDSDYVILMDADNSISVKEIMDNITGIQGNAALIFSRYSNKNKIPFFRKFISRGFNLLVQLFTGLRIDDTQTGYKIFNSQKFKNAINMVGVTNTFYDVSLLYHIKKQNGKIKEINANYVHDDRSTFTPLLEVLGQGVSLIAFSIRHSRFYKYVPESIIEFYYNKFKWI